MSRSPKSIRQRLDAALKDYSDTPVSATNQHFNRKTVLDILTPVVKEMLNLTEDSAKCETILHVESLVRKARSQLFKI